MKIDGQHGLIKTKMFNFKSLTKRCEKRRFSNFRSVAQEGLCSLRVPPSSSCEKRRGPNAGPLTPRPQISHHVESSTSPSDQPQFSGKDWDREEGSPPSRAAHPGSRLFVSQQECHTEAKVHVSVFSSYPLESLTPKVGLSLIGRGTSQPVAQHQFSERATDVQKLEHIESQPNLGPQHVSRLI